MIDAEVRTIAEGELQDGETLLWAEKTCHFTQDYNKSLVSLTPTRARYFKMFLAVAAIGLPLVTYFSFGIYNWGTRPQIIASDVLSALLLYGGLYVAVILFANWMTKSRVYRIGAYALTDRRLFEFDHDMDLIRHLDASRLEHVYGMEGVTLKPIGSKWPRSYQLGMMNNNVLTINYLHGQITRARKRQAQ